MRRRSAQPTSEPVSVATNSSTSGPERVADLVEDGGAVQHRQHDARWRQGGGGVSAQGGAAGQALVEAKAGADTCFW